MYNNPYLQSYNTQTAKDRIDNQIAQLQQIREQMSQPTTPAINQTFQLAPTTNGMRFANSIEDVNKEIVYVDTPFFSNDLSVVWLKNNKGNIKTFEMKELVPKDEKDIIIDTLQIQINELKEMIKNAKPNNANINESIKDEEPPSVPDVKPSKTKSK